ncbi:MAG: FecR domain-containing protein [Chloroflexi bacterium]|nr:MAG: FecR domain-containing protein [Chloroflexota bacterium]
MSVVAARPAPRRRGGYRLIIILLVVLLLIGAGIFWLTSAAQAATNAAATLTVFQPTVSVAHGGGAYATSATGAVVQPGDSIKTDAKGRAAIQLPDGTLTRLAGGTELVLTSAHFAKTGNLHDVSILQKIGRTFTNVQHLVGGATFKVAGQAAVASVRGTKFEVLVNPDGSMVVKLFDGQLDLDGKNHVHLNAGQQATVDAQGNVGQPGPIPPDPNDPFGPQIAASDASNAGTTPGTEQDFIGPPIHNGEQQQYTYSFAGGGIVKAALGYPGSTMSLRVKAPDGHVYTGTGASPIVVLVPNAPAGIYSITVIGVKGLGTAGEEFFLSVSALESCSSTVIAQNRAVRHGYTAQDLAGAINVPGLSNLNLNIVGDSIAGAIITGTGTYNGVGWTGTVVLFMHGGVLEIFAVGATVFNVSVPAEQIVQQIGSAIAQDPNNINPGFVVDRLFTCKGVLMIDGRVGS